jgi:dihydroxyacetone kinase-like protein
MGRVRMNDQVDLAFLSRWIREFARVISAHRQELTDLDAAIGDADHGINMDRGMTAVLAKMRDAPVSAPSALLKQVGMTLVSTVGGASGPLYGTFFLRMAAAASPETETLDSAGLAKAIRAGVDGVVQRGKAEAGDKTMFDALAPATTALEGAVANGAGLEEALRQAATAAQEGRDATRSMRARKGRASYLGERSVGYQDPGATSAALLIAAAATASNENVN